MSEIQETNKTVNVLREYVTHIITGIAAVLAFFMFSYMFNKIEALGKEISLQSKDIAVLQTNYNAINDKLNLIMEATSDTNRKVDRYIARESRTPSR